MDNILQQERVRKKKARRRIWEQRILERNAATNKLLHMQLGYIHIEKYTVKNARAAKFLRPGDRLLYMLDQNHEERVHQVLRTLKPTFMMLVDWCREHGDLKASKWISIQEKLAMFIYIVSNGVSNRMAQEHFIRSAGA
jgi:hypothetical protein